MLMLASTLQIALLIIITLIYALFDGFNKRNVPNIFAYASVVIGAVVLVATNPQSTIVVGALLAVLVGALCYILYRTGFLGGGDLFEFVAIVLLLPMQPQPLLTFAPQFNLPFILSVFIATGIVSVWAVPAYYLLFVRNKGRVAVEKKHSVTALALILAYFLLFMIIAAFTGFRLSTLALLLVIAVPSAIVLMFQKTITRRMVSDVYPKDLEDGDIIATNMMRRSDIGFFMKKSKRFQRLVTPRLMRDLRGVKRKMPVYKNAAPLALMTFVGVLLALAFGNLLLYVIF